MTQLMSEIVAYLVAAAGIGFLTGWWAQSARRRSADEYEADPQPANDDLRAEISEEVNSLVARLEEQERESSETIGHMASSIDELRSLLESQSMGSSETSDDDESDRESRERAERADYELDQLKRKFDELSNRHQKLQESFGKAADRIVEYERERLSGGKWDAKAPSKPPRTGLFRKPPDAGIRPLADPPASSASPGAIDTKAEALVLEHAFDIDTLDEPSAALGFDPPPSPEPVRGPDPAPAEPPIRPVSASAPPKPSASIEEQETKKPGARVALDQIDGIPKDVIARMELLGLKTNLDLLRKCGAQDGLKGLCMSMGLDARTLSRWNLAADLSRVGSIDAKTVAHLIEAGVGTVQSLAASEADDILSRLDSPDAQSQFDAELVQAWIDEAKELSTMLRY